MLGAHLTHIVLMVEEEVRVVLTSVTFASRDRDRVQVDAVDLRSLQDTDVLEIEGPKLENKTSLTKTRRWWCRPVLTGI